MSGLDVSTYSRAESWAAWKRQGFRFVYVKATEGTYFTSSRFAGQYAGARRAGLVRGAYHFANPGASSGTSQADYFIGHGGGWARDGKTLPGALDMEWNPYRGNGCYGKKPAQLETFVTTFVNRYRSRTGTRPVIYTSTSWWNACMGGRSWKGTPLWIADYRGHLGALPKAWNGGARTMWQTGYRKDKGYDTDVFNGGQSSLERFAKNGVR